MTYFYKIYERFLGKVTDDMYLELTPRDTFLDLRQLLVDSIPGFEFPRKRLDYVLVDEDAPDFIKGEIDGGDIDIPLGGDLSEEVAGSNIDIDNAFQEIFSEENTSYFNADLDDEEINILALIMVEAWVERQLASIEVTRMKYSGTDFKFTSQANHMQKLLSLRTEVRRQAFHMQRLYKRRKTDDDGYIKSNWSVLREVSALDD